MPTAPPAGPWADAAPRSSGTGGRGGAPAGYVLVVDDDPDLAETLLDLLCDRYPVEMAGDGEAALALVDRGPRPGVIVLDYRMPGMDGGEVAEQLRERGLADRVILMTAAKQAEVLAERHALRWHLRKPFGLEQLTCLLDEVLGGPKERP